MWNRGTWRAAAEVALVFLLLGLIAFGGPAAHVALMRRELVVRRKWLGEVEFLRLFAACNLIPGPSSTELAIYLSYRRAGWRGLVLGGVAFILPAMLIMFIIAGAYQRYGTSAQALGILYGIRAALVGIVVWAIVDLGRRLLRNWTLATLAAAVAGLFLIGASPVLLIVAGGLIVSAAAHDQLKPRVGIVMATSGPLPIWSGGQLLTIFLTFLKVGLVSFGSGYVLYAFLHADLVQGLHWLTDRQLIDAIAIGQATPGPVFTTATFLGYLFAGVPGGLVATIAIFLPGFFLVPMLDGIVRLTERRAWAHGFVDGANAAALGLMVAVTLEIGRSAWIDPLAVAMGLVALGIIWKWPLASPLVVLAAAAVGVIHLT